MQGSILPKDWPVPTNIGTDSSTGYKYFCDVTHPMSHRDGKVWLHRHIAAVKLGRWLGRHEHAHHKDTNRGNNLPDNIVVLSNSEHQRLHKGEVEARACKSCGRVFKPHQNKIVYCSTECAHIKAKKFDIDRVELERLVWELPTVLIARRFNVTDTAIAKRCRQFGIAKPPRGYWSKKYAGVA